MVVKVILLIYLLSTGLVCANDSVIKLDEAEIPSFEFTEQKVVDTQMNFSTKESKTKKLNFGSMESNLGPVKTKLQYNLSDQETQVEANMDLIEGYQFFKQKP